jgi:hypothetical protein
MARVRPKANDAGCFPSDVAETQHAPAAIALERLAAAIVSELGLAAAGGRFGSANKAGVMD